MSESVSTANEGSEQADHGPRIAVSVDNDSMKLSNKTICQLAWGPTLFEKQVATSTNGSKTVFGAPLNVLVAKIGLQKQRLRPITLTTCLI